MSEIPNGWAILSLGEMGHWGTGGTPSRTNPHFFGAGIPWIKSGDLPDGPIRSTEEEITLDGLEGSSAKRLPIGTVSMALYGATIGKLGILTFEATTNQACANVIPNSALVDRGYLFNYLLSQRDAFIKQGQGGAQPNISQGIVRSHPIPVPPLSEQRRIVAKLEELFSELDAGVEALRRAQRRLARYRQALLQAAVTGELTREWRERRTHGLKPGKLGSTEVPTNWRKVPFLEVIQSLRNGISVKPTGQQGTRILRISSVRAMRVDLSDVRYLEQPASDFDGFEVRPQDLLFTRYNGTPEFVGVCAMVPEFRGLLLYPDKLIRARLGTDEVLPAWVQVAFSAGSTREFISKRIRTTAGQAGISGGDLKKAPLPIPPVEEQHAILAELDRRLSAVEAMETTIQASLRRAERLRQSILERAFRGELVPQDPNDEPVEALLARLKAAAPDSPATRRQRRPPKTAPATPQPPRRRGRPWKVHA